MIKSGLGFIEVIFKEGPCDNVIANYQPKEVNR